MAKMTASDSVRKATYEKVVTEREARHAQLVQRLWERSEAPDDIWAEMAREAEAS